MQRKGMWVLLFLFSLLLAIPITPVIAKGLQRGDPEIVYVESELRIPEEIKKLPQGTAVSEAVYVLDVKLKATKQFASVVNGTLSFKEDLSAISDSDGFRPNKNLIITKNNTLWSSLSIGVAKNPLQPFIIKGLNRLPEKIAFKLDLVSVNPSDQEEYSKSLVFTLSIPQTEIRITSVTDIDGKDYDKGESIPLTVRVENIGTEGAVYITLWLVTESVFARGSSHPYKYTSDPLVLTEGKMFYITIPPGQYRDIAIDLPYKGYTNGAMNVGNWVLKYATAQAQNSQKTTVILNYNFDVIPKANGPHPVFIYYLWNSVGIGSWSEDPKNYFENGYGSCKAGLHRFEDNFYGVINLKMILCTRDASWSLPVGAYRSNAYLRSKGNAYVGSKLGIGSWAYAGHSINRENCGFDLLLLVACRSSDYMGTISGNSIVITKHGWTTPPSKWKHNIDGVVQHEISHSFGTLDYQDGHPACMCIMYYGSVWPFDHLHEYSAAWPFGNPYVTYGWCTASCKGKFQQYWDQFYSC